MLLPIPHPGISYLRPGDRNLLGWGEKGLSRCLNTSLLTLVWLFQNLHLLLSFSIPNPKNTWTEAHGHCTWASVSGYLRLVSGRIVCNGHKLFWVHALLEMLLATTLHETLSLLLKPRKEQRMTMRFSFFLSILITCCPLVILFVFKWQLMWPDLILQLGSSSLAESRALTFTLPLLYVSSTKLFAS